MDALELSRPSAGLLERPMIATAPQMITICRLHHFHTTHKMLIEAQNPITHNLPYSQTESYLSCVLIYKVIGQADAALKLKYER